MPDFGGSYPRSVVTKQNCYTSIGKLWLPAPSACASFWSPEIEIIFFLGERCHSSTSILLLIVYDCVLGGILGANVGVRGNQCAQKVRLGDCQGFAEVWKVPTGQQTMGGLLSEPWRISKYFGRRGVVACQAWTLDRYFVVCT